MQLAALHMFIAGLLLVAAACSGEGDDGSDPISLTVDPTAVALGGSFVLTAEINDDWSCQTTIVYPGVGAIRGGKGGVEETADTQTWTREVPAQAKPGRANIRVYCQQTDRGSFGGTGTGLGEVQVVAPQG